MRPNTLTDAFTSALVVIGANAGTLPTPNHNHQQVHAVKRSDIYTTVEVAAPTLAPLYVLDGKIVSQNVVCEGIEEDNLQLKDKNNPPLECSSSNSGTTKEPTETTTAAEVAPPQPSVTVQQKQEITAIPTQSSQAPEPSIEQDSGKPLQSSTATSGPLTPAIFSDSAPSVPSSATKTSSTETPTAETPSAETPSAETPSAETPSAETPSAETPSTETSSAETPSAETPSTETPSTETPSLQSGTISEGQGLELEFPDGEIDCSTFPSEYGPIEIEWANLGGWSGIQYITVEGNAVTHIDTAVAGGKGCIPGAMCSYACPPGYQKSQWPSTQGALGQSVGGIQCNANSKLSLTNPNLSKTLCMKGTGAVHVQNKLSTNAAICRTDYPGTENEVVPLNTQPDSISPLTCPDANEYFRWKGDPTSAQYYINNQGIAVQDACKWDSDGSVMGNWAPTTLGVGRDVNGRTWLSISTTAQNDPSFYSPLNYTVTIQGDISGNCRVSNGKYCTGDNYDQCHESSCLVELRSGNGTFILSD